MRMTGQTPMVPTPMTDMGRRFTLAAMNEMLVLEMSAETIEMGQTATGAMKIATIDMIEMVTTITTSGGKSMLAKEFSEPSMVAMQSSLVSFPRAHT